MLLYILGLMLVLGGLLLSLEAASQMSSPIIVFAPILIAAISSLVGGLLLWGVARLLDFALDIEASTSATANCLKALQARQAARPKVAA